MPTAVHELFDQQVRDMPASDQLHLMDLIVQHLAASEEAAAWAKRNQRRGRLIYQEYHGQLTAEEERELAALQREADQHMNRRGPRPLEMLEALEQRLLGANHGSV